MRFFSAILILLCSIPAQATKYAIVIGGSGEDFKKENFFLQDFARFDASLKKRGFEVVNIFNSSKTKEKFKSSDATNENIQKALDELQGKIKKGDEVAIIVHTHGYASGLSWGATSHNVLTESKHGFDVGKVGHLLKKIKDSAAYGALVDLSCYSGVTQEMVDPKDSPDYKKQTKSFSTNNCILTAAAPNYVSICSGDPSSNSFTAAFLDELEKSGPDRISAEQIFLSARAKDSSFTNMPQISSFKEPFKGKFYDWLKHTDPAGLNEDIDEITECNDCQDKSPKLDKAMSELAKNLKQKNTSLLESYKKAVEDQTKLQKVYSKVATDAYKKLLTLEKYKVLKNYKLSSIFDYASLENIPAPTLSKEGELDSRSQNFLRNFNYVDPILKRRMLLAQIDKSLMQDFLNDLKKMVLVEQKARDNNREKIQKLATEILQQERKVYAAKFKTTAGNPCQRFQF